MDTYILSAYEIIEHLLFISIFITTHRTVPYRTVRYGSSFQKDPLQVYGTARWSTVRYFLEYFHHYYGSTHSPKVVNIYLRLYVRLRTVMSTERFTSKKIITYVPVLVLR